MSTIEVDGLRIGFTRAGAGPAVVLLHGYVGDGPATWHPQLDRLADQLTVIAWDAPGAGRSSNPPESLGVTGYADTLARFLTALGIERPHVVGLSFGGIVALELSRRHPERVRTLVLVSAYAGWTGSLGADEARRRLDQALRLAELSPTELVDALLPTMFRPGTPPPVRDRFAETLRAVHPAGFRAMARASAGSLRDALPAVRAPTLVVHGTDDVRAPRPVAVDLCAAIAGAMLVAIPDAGHLCNLEQPDRFDSAVRAFWSATE